MLGHVERAARGSPSTATTTSTASASTAILVRALRDARRRRRLVPAEPHARTATGSGAATVERLAERGTRAAAHRRLRDHRGRRGRAARAARASTSSSPTTTSRAPTARCPTRRSCTRRSAATRARTCARPASPTSSRGALLAAAGRDPAGADADLDLVALATVADCVPLRGENRRLVRDGPARARRDTQRPGLRALMRVARGAIPARVDARASASGSRRGSTPPAACTAPTPALELLLTDDRRARRRDRRGARRANAERRHVETRILFEAEAQVAELGRAPGLRARRRGLAPGRDRHRRLADRRAPPPPVRADRARRRAGAPARGARSRRSTCSAGSTRAPSTCCATAATAPPPAARSRATRVDALPRRVRGARRSGARRPRTSCPSSASTRSSPATSSGSTLAEELERLAPFGIGNPAVSLLVPAARLRRRAADGGGQARALHRRGRRRARARRRVRHAAPARRADDGARRDLRARAQRVERRGRAAAASCATRARAAARRRSSSSGEPEDDVEAALRGVRPAARRAARRRPATAGAADRGAGSSATAAARASPGRSARSSPRASRCSSSAPTRARRAGLAGRLGGFALLLAGTRSSATRRSPRFDHVVALDPPPDRQLDERCTRPAAGQMAHLAWGEPELRFVAGCTRRARPRLRAALAALYRALRDGGRRRASASFAGRPVAGAARDALLRVLAELGLVDVDASAAQRRASPARRRHVELERSRGASARCARAGRGAAPHG